MKTYCKPAVIDIESAGFCLTGTKKAFKGKLKRNDFQRELIGTGVIKRSEIAQERLDKQGKHPKTDAAIAAYNEMLTECIVNRDLGLLPIRQFEREDGLTHKLRTICQESVKQQVLEYIAVEALMPLFRAKLLPVQYGSIPGRGQVAGKRKIERILRRKLTKDTAVIKGDVKKAYPSVTTGCVMELLRRDIGKNKPLLWFIGALMENYPDGHLCIGSYLSTWLFNYVMSYVLRYMLDQYQIRRGIRTKLVHATVCYADDFSLFGNYSQLKKVLKKTSRWCTATLHININPAWTIYRLSSFEAEKELQKLRKSGCKKRTQGVDMVGFVYGAPIPSSGAGCSGESAGRSSGHGRTCRT